MNCTMEAVTYRFSNNTFCSPLLKDKMYSNETERDSVLSEECNSRQKMNNYIKSNEDIGDKNAAESEQISFETTDDESMAVEALRQLGGMYPNVVTTEQALPMLSCNICSMKFQTTADLRVHMLTCRLQMFPNYRCSVCCERFNNELEYNDHSCVMTRLPCKYCYTYFTTRIELEKHIQSNHNTDRPYKCHFCSMTFPRSSSLANHSKIHNYLPGRDLLNNSNKVVVADPMNISTWTFESVYVSDNAENNASTDPLTNWNLDYVSNPLLQGEVTEELGSANQEITISNFPQQFASESSITDKSSEEKLNDSLDFQMPIKIELMPYGADIEKCLDEPFPITSMPQMEITIGTDSKKPHVCPECGMNFSRKKALISHLKLHSIGWALSHECENCGEAFTNEISVQQHKKSCGIVLDQTFEPNANIQSLNKKTAPKNSGKPQVKVGKHRCPECDKHFTTKQKMFRHLWIHRKKSFSCELCGMTFALQVELDKHRLSIHPADSPYVCNECGKSFASRQGLWEHGRVHGGGSAGLFSCSHCSKTFASRQGYLIHQRTHTDERPYGCRFCLKAFRDGGTLRKHERIHTGYRPYVCPICSHDFNQKVVLREHVRWVHTANKTENDNGVFLCQICNINVSDREELCAHIVKHSDLLAIQAKNTDSLNQNSVNNKIKKKSGTSNLNNVYKVANASSKKNIKSKQEHLEINSENFIREQFEIFEDKNNIECDLCGDKFSSQKALMAHVRIHI